MRVRFNTFVAKRWELGAGSVIASLLPATVALMGPASVMAQDEVKKSASSPPRIQ